MELEGYGTSEIAACLGTTASAIGNILSKARRQRSEQTAKAIDLHRAILLERAEMLIEKFMPIALDADLLAQIERGEAVDAKRLDRAMRSALVMLSVMDFQCRLLALYPAGSIRGPWKEEKDETLSWLRTQELVKSPQAGDTRASAGAADLTSLTPGAWNNDRFSGRKNINL
jgi:hypothetical protein